MVDFAIVNLKKEQLCTPEALNLAFDYTRYAGWKFRGRPVVSYEKRELVMQDGKVLKKPSVRAYLRRELTTFGNLLRISGSAVAPKMAAHRQGCSS